ncbi:MAG TPA: hypothetical protein VF033_13445 [Steroidobacteraceae bacterium]
MVAILAGACASACDDAPPARPAGDASPSARPAKAESPVPPNMVAAVSASKTSSVLGVHFALESAPVVGKPLGVDILVVPHREFTTLRVNFETPEGLILATGDRFAVSSGIKAETAYSHKLVIQPQQEGVYLITVGVETVSEDGSVTRIYSIPLIVYGANAEPRPAATPAAAAAPAS